MKQYLDLMKGSRDECVKEEDRTGTGTVSIFGYQMRVDLEDSFPLLTTKKVNRDSIIHELLWFISGDTNISYLVKNGVNIWNDWPYQSYLKQTDHEENYPMHSKEWKGKMKEFIEQIKNDNDFAKVYGDLGPVYGRQWRDFEGVDQLNQVVEDIKSSPDSRRLIVSAWNPKDIPVMVKSGLPPCHTLFQFYVSEGRLSCQLYQRSADVFLGVPYNIASYAILTLMIAQVTGLKPGEFILFNERTVHHSEPHRSQKRRIGLAVRVVVPIVKVLTWDSPEHALLQISGRDPMGLHTVTQPPLG